MKFLLPLLLAAVFVSPTLAGCGAKPGVAPVARPGARTAAKSTKAQPTKPVTTPAATPAAPVKFLTQSGARVGAYAPSGDKLAFEAADGRIYLAAADGSMARVVGEGRMPAWSASGGAIAFVKPLGAGRGDALVAHTVASGKTDVLFESRDGLRDPAWLADGRTLFFASGGALVRLTLGAAPVALHQGAGIGRPTVAADGRTLVFEADGGLSRLNLATGAVEALRVTGAHPRQPSFSPSGRSLAYVADEGVYVALADGTGARLMLSGSGLAAPGWHPAGAQLVLAVPRGAGSDLRSLELVAK